ncbi:MAG: hypothetical protein IAC87_00640 [Muribaculum sp.]|uniref:Uncharacterized protein n=1 Tax=Candidatus Merdivivens faecigallinarum TaxID=2840871 RepID=A0A9D9NPJ1_9BACT|nr:hypothetical protein [Candidatus Merdivivens faecigallinarum]
MMLKLAADILFVFLLSYVPVDDDYLSSWTEARGRRFEIVQGYMKDVIVDMMYDETVPIPGGIFAISFSFDCVDFQGKELGCGLYCDNQWGGNRDEQYYFIPLKYEVIGKNHFRLYPDEKRKIMTNKGAPVDWVEKSESMSKLLKELCTPKGWYIGYMPDSYLGTSRWIFKRADSPEVKQLYYNTIES